MFDNKDGMIYKEVPEDDHTFHYEKVCFCSSTLMRNYLLFQQCRLQHRWKNAKLSEIFPAASGGGRNLVGNPCRIVPTSKSKIRDFSIESDIPPNWIGTTDAHEIVASPEVDFTTPYCTYPVFVERMRNGCPS